MVIGREYRLRYSRQPRVRALSEVSQHDTISGKTRRVLKVEVLDVETGKALDREPERIMAGEILGEWDDSHEREIRERNQERNEAMAELEAWLDEVGIGAHVLAKRGSQSRVLLELEPRHVRALLDRLTEQ